MRFLERHNEEHRRQADGDSDSSDNDQLQHFRSQGNQLLAAGDAAIQRALGRGNSEAFLRAGRQQSGE
ncbi:MAG: hypothetical protein ABSA94_08845 [Acidobacteriaceae bacterium]|jgi:hypothetical protein